MSDFIHPPAAEANIAYGINKLIQETQDLYAYLDKPEHRALLQKELSDLEYAHRDLGMLIFLLKRPAVDLREFSTAAE